MWRLSLARRILLVVGGAFVLYGMLLWIVPGEPGTTGWLVGDGWVIAGWVFTGLATAALALALGVRRPMVWSTLIVLAVPWLAFSIVESAREGQAGLLILKFLAFAAIGAALALSQPIAWSREPVVSTRE